MGRASAGPRDVTRCAYCHAGEGDLLARCAACGTLVHADCRAAHGACPTLGCAAVARPGPHLDRPLSPLGRGLLRAARWLFGP